MYMYIINKLILYFSPLWNFFEFDSELDNYISMKYCKEEIKLHLQ